MDSPANAAFYASKKILQHEANQYLHCLPLADLHYKTMLCRHENSAGNGENNM